MKRRRAIAFCIALAWLLAAQPPRAQAQPAAKAPEKVTLALQWLPRSFLAST